MTPPLSIILVRPQLGENIGLAARAMGNFDIKDLRIVSPRDAWPNPSALSASVGAHPIIENAATFTSLEEAIKDLSWVFGATARLRYIKKTAYDIKEAASFSTSLFPQKVGVVFGPEQTGLTNEEVSFCHAVLSIPTSPSLSSLNLAHAVLLCVYEFSQRNLTPHPTSPTLLATHEEVFSLLSFLEMSLEKKGFFFPEEKKEKMKQNLRDIFLRTPLSVDDTNTLFGALKVLQKNVDKSSFS